MANDKFSISEALSYGWDTFKGQIGFFLGLIVVMAAVTVIPDVIIDKVMTRGSALSIILKLGVRLVGMLLGMVVTKISLDIVDTGRSDLSKLSELLPIVPAYVIGKLIYGVIVLVGMLLLLIPGFIWAYMFLYIGYLIIDRQIGPIDALKESRAITSGYKWSLALFSLVVALINIGGAICLLVGLFVTIPVTLMASAYVYRRLSPKVAA